MAPLSSCFQAFLPVLCCLFVAAAAFDGIRDAAYASDIAVGAPPEEMLLPDSAVVTPEIAWQAFTPGLALGLARLPESADSESMFVALRIDPEQHEFMLSMASEAGQAYSLVDWCLRHNLRAGINASMFLQDKLTSTGYMRNGRQVNNSGMGSRLGAFFVAGPEQEGPPRADIIERGSPDWLDRLGRYSIVVQNYRFMDEAGKLLWREDSRTHSIAVVAREQGGAILFILCQPAVTVQHFASYLKQFFPDLGTVMYVEGGGQAGVFLYVPGTDSNASPKAIPGASVHTTEKGSVYVWKGRQSLLNTKGNPDAVLPNIIGVRR